MIHFWARGVAISFLLKRDYKGYHRGFRSPKPGFESWSGRTSSDENPGESVRLCSLPRLNPP